MQPKAVVIDYRDRKAYGLSQLISLQQQCQAFEAVLSSAKVGVCYSRSTVVSNLDVGGFVLNVDGGSWQEAGL
jgi:ABC-type uncharacterized transport system substrate-binding protein